MAETRICSGTFYKSGNRNKWVYEVYSSLKDSNTVTFRIKTTPYYECQNVGTASNQVFKSYSGGASTLKLYVDGTEKFSYTMPKRDSLGKSGNAYWTNYHDTFNVSYDVPIKIGAYIVSVTCSSPSLSDGGSIAYVTTIPIYINLNDSIKAMDKAYVNIDDSIKECTVYVRVGDTIKTLN